MYPTYPRSGLSEPGDILQLVEGQADRDRRAEFVQLGDYENITTYKFGKVAVSNYRFGQVAAGAETSTIVIEDLKPHQKHIIQARFGIFGPCQLYLYVPSSLQLGGIDQKQVVGSSWRELGYYDQFKAPPYNFAKLTERYYTWKYYPAFRAYNPTKTPQSPEVVFAGRLFEHEPVVDRNLISALETGRVPYRRVMLGGIEKLSPK